MADRSVPTDTLDLLLLATSFAATYHVENVPEFASTAKRTVVTRIIIRMVISPSSMNRTNTKFLSQGSSRKEIGPESSSSFVC